MINIPEGMEPRVAATMSFYFGLFWGMGIESLIITILIFLHQHLVWR